MATEAMTDEGRDHGVATRGHGEDRTAHAVDAGFQLGFLVRFGLATALGAAVFPGPLVATFFATQVLDGELRQAIAQGQAVVSLGHPPLMPWAPVAGIFLEIAGERVFEARVAGELERVEMLGPGGLAWALPGVLVVLQSRPKLDEAQELMEVEQGQSSLS